MKTETLNKELVKADIYRILSIGFSYPDENNLSQLLSIGCDLVNNEKIEDEKTVELLQQILASIKKDEIVSEYSRMFLKGSIPMNESFCCSKLDAVSDVGAFYKAFGMNAKSGDAPDALPYELEFCSALLVKISLAKNEEQKNIAYDAYKKFLNDHLKEFTQKFSAKVKEVEVIDFYKNMISLLEQFVGGETINLN